MASLEQQFADLENSLKSTGPNTTEGKHRTRLNAYKHGLTGQIHLQTAAENEAFELHCAGIRESLQPVGALEIEIAQGIAEAIGASNAHAPSRPPSSPLASAVNSNTLAAGDSTTPKRFPPTKRWSKPAPGSPRATISSFWPSTSSASTAPLRRVWPSSALSAPSAKPPGNRRSKNSNCLPS